MSTEPVRVFCGERTSMEVPKAVQVHLTHVGGRNRFNEPNFRLVWGPDRLEWVGGRFEKASGFGPTHVGLHRIPKYPADEWVFERWLAPETFGSKESWKREFTQRVDGLEVEMLGPFPTRGDYEMVTSFSPIALTSKVAEYLAQVIERSRGFRHAERREAILGRMEKKDADYDKFCDDVMDDAFSPFPAAHVALSS
jgi:hypothetical protein